MIPLFRSQRKTIRYRLPSRVAAGFLWAVLTLRPRSLARDAQKALAGLRPVLEITGKENIPTRGPFLLPSQHLAPFADEKTPHLNGWGVIFWLSSPKGSRTPVSGLRGRRPRPLDDGATQVIFYQAPPILSNPPHSVIL